jgi:ABC-type Fe3+/spermidine/putrescine transport system ATPase subunit
MGTPGAVALSIQELHKTFPGKDDRVTALAGVSLEVREGELFTLLGPSGCGKTTTLRCIAGFEKPSSGRILFQGRDFTAVPPFRRGIGMVFQSYALFPHLSVYENVAYGLRVRHRSREETRDKVGEILKLVGLESTARRKPGELSGGQQQRIALARALIYDPKLLLLDEPLSNLDAKLRIYMREEIRRIQQQAGVTAIYVTHDQEEALSISDRIAVMHAGLVSQVGSPDEIYENPSCVRVADFIGQANFLACRVVKQAGTCSLRFPSMEQILLPEGLQLSRLSEPESEAILFVRPEHLHIRGLAAEGDQGPAGLRGRVRTVLYLGTQVRYFLEVFSGASPKEILVDEKRRVPGVRDGSAVMVGFRWEGARLFPSEQRDQLAEE